MRVLLDGRPIRRPISGVAQYTCNLAEELARFEGVDLKLLTLEYRARAPDTEFPLDASRLYHIARLPRKLFNIGTEHLHLPIASWVCGEADVRHETFFGCLPTRPRCPLVSTIHDVIPIEHPERFTTTNAFYSRRNFWRQLRESDAIIAVSAYTRQKIVEVGRLTDDSRVHIVPNGVRDLSSLVTAEAVGDIKRRFEIDRPYLLYVGNLEPRKGVATLLRAFARSRQARGMQLVVAGRKCWDFDEIEAVAREFPAGEVVIPGYVSEAEKAALMSGASLFVYPSTYEGFGIPVIEAMSCGCPVIAARNSSLIELCEGAGVLFETGSAEDLAEKIDGVLSTPALRAELIAAGRTRAERYTWRSAAEATVAVYRRVLNEK